jgi:thiosulfate/3-mercaptopyruvate sulfurtransferase
MIKNAIISTAELEMVLDNPDWVVVDCRFDLQDSDWGYHTYLAGHIPFANYAHLDYDLSGKITQSTGRHPLPIETDFSKALSNWGIEPSTNVVVYDSNGGAFAARLWWMLCMIHHPSVYVLNGGIPKWEKEGRKLQSGSWPKASKNYGPVIYDPNMYATTAEVCKLLSKHNALLIDARSPERYRGEIEPIDTLAGHIPSALNRFHGLNLESDGTFKTPSVLWTEFSDLFQQFSSKDTIVYCGSGVTSCHHLLAMRITGFEEGRVYIGSWSEWIRDPNRPRLPDNQY